MQGSFEPDKSWLKTPKQIRSLLHHHPLLRYTSAISLIPLFLTGILTDILGSQAIFLLMGGAISLLGLFALRPALFFSEAHLPYNMRQFLGLGHWEKRIELGEKSS